MEGVRERITIYVEYTGTSMVDFANLLGVSRSYLYRVIKGKAKVSKKFIENIIEKVPEINQKWLREGKGTMLVNKKISSREYDDKPGSIVDFRQVPAHAEFKGVIEGLEKGDYVCTGRKDKPISISEINPNVIYLVEYKSSTKQKTKIGYIDVKANGVLIGDTVILLDDVISIWEAKFKISKIRVK